MDHIAAGVRFQLYPLTRKKRLATLICYHVGSRRERLTFSGDEEAAKKHCKTLARQVTSGEEAIHFTPLENRIWTSARDTALKIGRPVDAIVREHLEALQLLGPGVSVLEAARDWRRRNRLGLPRIEIAAVIAELLSSLEGKRRAASTIRSLRIPLNSLASHLRMPIGDVQTSDLEQWLRLYPRLAPRTQNNWIAAAKRLFNFCKRRYLPADSSTAADALESVTNDRRGAVAIFQPWELQKILSHASDRLRPIIAIGAFAGLRTIELHRLDWSAIHFSILPDDTGKPAAQPKGYPHGFIEVAGNIAKQHRTAARRLIPIQANLAEWLEPFRFSRGRLSPYCEDTQLSARISQLIQRLNAVQKKHRLPLLSRPKNGLRHSFGSYRLPVIESVDLLSLEMNNSPQEIMENYREIVHPARVPEYWGIVPPRSAEIEQLDFATAW